MTTLNCERVAKEYQEPELEAVETVCRRALDLQPEDDCTIELFSDELLYTLHLVVIPSRQQSLLLRTPLPLGETIEDIAILDWVRHCTDIPVPHVIAFDQTANNEIGFGWRLMPFIASKRADKVWDEMSVTAKEAFTKQVAEFQAQLLDASETKSRLLGQLVSCRLTKADYYKYDVPWEPFYPSRGWIESNLRNTMSKVGSGYFCTQDGTIERQLHTAELLLDLLPTVFPAIDQHERTAIYQSKFSLQNILVDEEGAITAILGWGYASGIPCHYATEVLPLFLTEPIHVDMDQAEARAGHRPFSEDQMEHEQTHLRKIYMEHMGELRPTWDAEVASSTLKNDFIRAAALIYTEDFISPIDTWTRAIKNGENVKLDDVLDTWRQQQSSHRDANSEGKYCSSQDSDYSSSSEWGF
ncbi:hypothetical protein LCI18_006377 [Fusarium solani-melongenae]|uniref:Uncharacterized protein n=1 Tax=Fusarium solani subsp. cucurbitae TaxID=2747967 RepID=A0ACD3Z2L5_FUSSC|nr:hypothetical protein LCI18_006377 [Fusarium solani-melongenae]